MANRNVICKQYFSTIINVVAVVHKGRQEYTIEDIGNDFTGSS